MTAPSKPFGEDSPELVAEVYRSLRAQVFGLSKSAPASEAEGLLALVMETATADYCYSLVAVADGALSLYLSNGGGSIGAGALKRVGQRVRLFVHEAAQYEQHAEPTDAFPLPAVGQTAFYFVGRDRVSAARHDERDLGEERVPLSPLFHRAQHLLSIIHRVNALRESELDIVFAAEFGEVDLLDRELAGGADPHTRASDGTPLIGIAVRSGAAEITQRLIDAGVDANTRITSADGREAPLLYLAASRGDTATCDALLAAGARVDEQDSGGMSALHAAAFAGEIVAVTLLLQRGAKLELAEASGCTPLMVAANAGNIDCASLLLHAGAKVNAGDHSASTPIMFAAQHGFEELVRLLLECGADPSMVGAHGLSALAFAKQNGHTEVARLLQA